MSRKNTALLSRDMLGMMGFLPSAGIRKKNRNAGAPLGATVKALVDLSKEKKSAAPSRREKDSTTVSARGAQGGGPRLKRVSAPATDSVVVPGFFIRASGLAQKLTDESGPKDSSLSIRIVGCDQIFTVSTGGSGTGIINGGGQYISLTPATFGARLQGFTRAYQWYAFREVNFRVVPYCGTGTAGLISLGISNNPFSFLPATDINTTGEVMQLIPSTMTPIWNPVTLRYKFHGTKLFSTTLGSGGSAASNSDYIQALIYGAYQGLAVSSSYAVVVADYVIDLYGPTPITTVPSLPLREPLCAKDDGREEKKVVLLSQVKEDYTATRFDGTDPKVDSSQQRREEAYPAHPRLARQSGYVVVDERSSRAAPASAAPASTPLQGGGPCRVG